ncbi:cytochrome P450 [Lasiosphaeria miniovina]|uniref:Cytochrome P450 n=1 Tax=Lasiosphaeria miniovina TaxID=1954250 RepID=A0AA40B4W2_9PEZI|nr:cytochrome P450 [Lasiosphaeria miniovina]KAK0727677.1 cytochrome P450 [Lasiosphaeria miniovina]
MTNTHVWLPVELKNQKLSPDNCCCIRDKHSHAIYTLRFPGVRMYVVNAPRLIPLIERQTATLSFAPVESAATAAVLGTSDATNRIMAADPASPDNHFAVFRKTVRPVLAPGPFLAAMFMRSFTTMSRSLDVQFGGGRAGVTTKLLAWTGREITLAGTTAEYGEANPFSEPDVYQAWQTFVSGLPLFVSGFYPHIFARRSFAAREFLVSRFARYLGEGSHLASGGSSGAVLARLRHNAAAGMPFADSARGEVGACMALLNNTIPGMFWVVYHIFSDPAVLADVRAELMATAVTDESCCVLDVERVRTACPLLQSTVCEVYRFRGIGTGMVRVVVRDDVLDGRHLLKKGGLVFAPNSLPHFAPALWGPDCDRFDHRRFLRGGSAAGGGNDIKSVSSSALRIFGGGTARCPGRHFAGGNLLMFAAMLALRADIRPVDGEAAWAGVTVSKSFGLGIATGFVEPDRDIDVVVAPVGGQPWHLEFPPGP